MIWIQQQYNQEIQLLVEVISKMKLLLSVLDFATL